MGKRNVDKTIEIWGILIEGPEAFDYGNSIALSCRTTYGKRFGIRMDKNAYKSMGDPKGRMRESLFRQVWQDKVIVMQVTYETRDTLHKPHK